MYRYRVRIFQSPGIVREAHFWRLKSAKRYVKEIRWYYFVKFTTFANQVDPVLFWEIQKSRWGQWDYVATGGSREELTDMLRGISES